MQYPYEYSTLRTRYESELLSVAQLWRGPKCINMFFWEV